MKEQLIRLIAHLQALKLSYHNAHHIASRVAFFGDHDALGGFYSEVDSDYDGTSERCVGIFGQETLNLPAIMGLAMVKIQAFPSTRAVDNSALFTSLLGMENELITQVELLCKLPECRESDKQLISEVGNKSVARTYKLKQRIRK